MRGIMALRRHNQIVAHLDREVLLTLQVVKVRLLQERRMSKSTSSTDTTT